MTNGEEVSYYEEMFHEKQRRSTRGFHVLDYIGTVLSRSKSRLQQVQDKDTEATYLLLLVYTGKLWCCWQDG